MEHHGNFDLWEWEEVEEHQFVEGKAVVVVVVVVVVEEEEEEEWRIGFPIHMPCLQAF